MKNLPILCALLGDLLKPLENVILFNFISALTGRHLFLDNDHILLSLPVRFGGLAIPLFHNDAKCEYENSRKLILSQTQSVKVQYQIYLVNKMEQRSIKANIKINKEERYKTILTQLRTHLNENQKVLSNITQEREVSNWLMGNPISDQ